jgi:cellobiose phosphorylase
MKYGEFKDEAREYVITNPKTPVKWINYIGDLRFGGFVDHTGGALICKGDPSLNRITKYIQQMPSSDFKGETLYIRIKKNGAYKVFSPFFVPTLDRYDSFECRVGLGYNKIVSEFYGVKTECTIFIPQDAQVELRDIRVTNVSGAPMEIDVIPVLEYTHFDALKQFNNADWVPQTMQSRRFENSDGMMTLIQYAFMNRDTKVNYFTSNFPVSSFETDRRVFLGDNEYGTWAAPRALHDFDEFANNEAHRGDNIGALMHRLGLVKPYETKRIITQLGQKESLAVALPEIEKFRDEAEVDKAFNALAAFWAKHLDTMQVETPDAAFNSMVNVHNPRQCFTTYYWSRYLSYYQLGMGTRGLGFRDSSQDVMGVVSHMPEMSRELIVKLLSVQNADGSAMHQFNPMSMEATNGDAHEMPDRPQYYGDDHLWIVLAVSAYIKETGEALFLDENVSYYEKDSYGAPVESGTVYDHLARALRFTKQNMGNHGLPLLGFADWNDCVNLPTGAESMFNACLYGRALLEMIDLEEFLGNRDKAEAYKADHALMKKNLNEQAWDGEWYVRYYEADGTPLGSSKNSHGQIYLNGQSWPVFSGLATEERARQALDSARKLLNTPKGLKLSMPGFNGYDPTKGGITTYPPGAKENGGIFLHTNPWMMIAEAIMGNGERAYEYYNQINPAAKNDIIDEYECEPYVYPQNILGDEHPQFGLARNSWLSGTSSWTYQAASRYILGLRPQMDGLLIDPCVPPSWDRFSVERNFRGCRYVINVENPNKVCKGVKSISVDGKTLDKPVVPVFTDGQKHEVHVVMG